METLDKNVLPGKNKEQLLADQERLKAEMEYQLDGIKGDAADIGKKLLLVGGGVYLTYKLVRLATRSKHKNGVEYHGKGSPLVIKKQEKVAPTFGSLMKQQLMTIAVLIIASKIKGILKERKLLDE